MGNVVSYHFAINDPALDTSGDDISKKIIEEMNAGKMDRLTEFLNTTGMLTQQQAKEVGLCSVPPGSIFLHMEEHRREPFLGLIPRPPKKHVILNISSNLPTEILNTFQDNARKLNIPTLELIAPFTLEELENMGCLHSELHENRTAFRARKTANRKRRKHKHRHP